MKPESSIKINKEVLPMNEYQLKYGCNPNQKPSRVFMKDGSNLPIEILNGRAGYINLLDAFNGSLSASSRRLPVFLPQLLSSMYHLPVRQSVFLSLMSRRKSTGLTIWAI